MFRLLFSLIVGVGGLSILLSLGIWQMQRLQWKEDLIQGIEQRVQAPVQPLPEALDTEKDRYLPVFAEGQFRPINAARMLASRRQIGAVHRHIVAFELTDTRSILVDIGWTRAGTDLQILPSGPLRLEGNLDWPNETDGFTPPPDLKQALWYARDVASLSESLQTDPVLLVLRSAPSPDFPATPWPVDISGIPNDHLQYAVTWFSLAAIWAGMTFYFLRRNRRRA